MLLDKEDLRPPSADSRTSSRGSGYGTSSRSSRAKRRGAKKQNKFNLASMDEENKSKARCVYITLNQKRERNVLFNDALNTFYLRLYGFRHMVKDHSDSEKGNPLPPHSLLLSTNSKGSFICTIPQTG